MCQSHTGPGEGWKTVRKIGEGSCSSVYEIHREDFGKVYKAAMKVVHLGLSEQEIKEEESDPKAVSCKLEKRIQVYAEELACMASLRGHTNILADEEHKVIRDPKGTGWTILIRMELMMPLAVYLQKNGCSEETAVKIGRDLLTALEICHERKIIHGEIRIENIYVNDRGDFKLGGFGLSRVTSRISAAGRDPAAGDPEHLPYEVMKEGKYSPASDLYAVGVLLYRLLNRMQPPALKPDAGQTFPAPLYGSSHLKKVILKATAFKPEERYQSAEGFRRDLIRKEEIPPLENLYRQALQREGAAKSEPAFREAEEAFRKLGSYKNSGIHAEWCRKEAERVKTASELSKGEPIRLSDLQKPVPSHRHTRTRIGVLTTLLVLFLAVIGWRFSGREVVEDIQKAAAEAQIGEILSFGTYEQDGSILNGREKILWIVADKETERVLLLARDVLEIRRYDEAWKSAAWENCTLRTWLNGEFFYTAFDEKERGMILEAELKTTERQEDGEEAEYITKDKVFCLSVSAAETFFGSDEERVGALSDYAAKQAEDSEETGWWLRSSGDDAQSIAYIAADGELIRTGEKSAQDCMGVRPALWIDLREEVSTDLEDASIEAAAEEMDPEASEAALETVLTACSRYEAAGVSLLEENLQKIGRRLHKKGYISEEAAQVQSFANGEFTGGISYENQYMVTAYSDGTRAIRQRELVLRDPQIRLYQGDPFETVIRELGFDEEFLTKDAFLFENDTIYGNLYKTRRGDLMILYYPQEPNGLREIQITSQNTDLVLSLEFQKSEKDTFVASEFGIRQLGSVTPQEWFGL